MMDKKKSKYKDDYSLRTLAYYQREGGVYNELITILQRMRIGKGGRKILPPNKILNAATGAFDIYMDRCKDEENDTIIDYGLEELAYEIYGGCVAGPLGGLDEKNELIVLCVLCVLLARYPVFNKRSIPKIIEIVKNNDPSVYKEFETLIASKLEDKDANIESLRNQLAIKDSLIRDKDSQIARLSNDVSELEKRISVIEPVFDVYVQNRVEGSKFDQYLTLDAVLGWVNKRKHYKLADQVITMLKDLGRNTATDEEYGKIEALESELLSKYSELSIVNNNMGVGSNILTGITQNPLMPMGGVPEQFNKFLEYLKNGEQREHKD